jgi:integrase
MSAWKYKRKDSPYWWIGWYDPATGEKGKPYSTKTRNEREASLMVKEKERELLRKANEQSIITPARTAIKFSEAFELYKQDKRNSQKSFTEGTIGTYTRALKYLYKSCGDKPVHKYDRSDYHKFINSMSSLSHNTKALNSSNVYAIFRFLTSEKFIKENPFKRLPLKQKEFTVLTDAEVGAIRSYAASTKYASLIDFQILSAFRLDEAVNCRTKNIRDGRISVKAKGGKMRSIPISDEMQAWLDCYFMKSGIKKGGDVRLFNFPYKHAVNFWSKLKRDLNLGRGRSSHALRKYTLTNMANSGVPINYVMEYAGHTDIKTTLQYYVKNDLNLIAGELNKKVVFIKKDA